jgi:hypothetical protein
VSSTINSFGKMALFCHFSKTIKKILLNYLIPDDSLQESCDNNQDEDVCPIENESDADE